MNKKIPVIAIALAVLLAIGASFLIWKNNEIKKQEKIKAQQQEEAKKIEQEKQRSNLSKESDLDIESQTIESLLQGAEEVKVPAINTKSWNTYQDEELGLEFKYPKKWRAYTPTQGNSPYVCIATLAEKYELPEGGIECLIQLAKAERDENLIVNEIRKWKEKDPKTRLRIFKQKYFTIPFLWTDTTIYKENPSYSEIYIKNKNIIISLSFNDYFKKEEIRTTFYGVLTTLKPL